MESFSDLLDQAIQMLMDRSKQEQDLIYSIAKLDVDLRSAIVMGYRILHENKEENAMDDEIKKIKKTAKKEVKDLDKLEKADKKRDKMCKMGEKEMKEHKKK